MFLGFSESFDEGHWLRIRMFFLGQNDPYFMVFTPIGSEEFCQLCVVFRFEDYRALFFHVSGSSHSLSCRGPFVSQRNLTLNLIAGA